MPFSCISHYGTSVLAINPMHPMPANEHRDTTSHMAQHTSLNSMPTIPPYPVTFTVAAFSLVCATLWAHQVMQGIRHEHVFVYL